MGNQAEPTPKQTKGASRRYLLRSMWLIVIGIGLIVLAHLVPAPFVLDAIAGDKAVWHMPRDEPSTVYLTYDDGPNPSTTPDLLDVLAREATRATFFLIDSHVTNETAPIIRRMFAEGHAVALHSGNRWDMGRSPGEFARMLTTAADRIEILAGTRPCPAFRPHGGWRSASMFTGLRQIDHRLIGWGWMLWDVDPFRARTPDRIVARISSRVRAGDIVVMHDGDEKAPRKPQPQTLEATARLIGTLRDRGLRFGVVCENAAARDGRRASGIRESAPDR
jgi:peptidoglycan-N-acetylglucosamine deacetylase